MNEWDEVFRTGKHTDSQGREREFSTGDLDRMVNAYDPASHEAPVVIGHPKDNAPAFGWVESLQRVGDVLMAKYHQVAPEFKEMVKAGRFKKRSISIYPDGSLRHVGFLGAQPPAIKGLKDFAFNDADQAAVYEFSDNQTNQEGSMKPTVEELQKKLEDEQAARQRAEQQGRDYKEKYDRQTADFAEAKKQQRRKEIVDFVDGGIKDGKILPAWKEQGLVEFMAALDEQGGEYTFCEGRKQSPQQWFRDFISSFAGHPLFKEFTAADNGAGGADAGGTFDPTLTSHV